MNLAFRSIFAAQFEFDEDKFRHFVSSIDIFNDSDDELTISAIVRYLKKIDSKYDQQKACRIISQALHYFSGQNDQEVFISLCQNCPLIGNVATRDDVDADLVSRVDEILRFTFGNDDTLVSARSAIRNRLSNCSVDNLRHISNGIGLMLNSSKSHWLRRKSASALRLSFFMEMVDMHVGLRSAKQVRSVQVHSILERHVAHMPRDELLESINLTWRFVAYGGVVLIETDFNTQLVELVYTSFRLISELAEGEASKDYLLFQTLPQRQISAMKRLHELLLRFFDQDTNFDRSFQTMMEMRLNCGSSVAYVSNDIVSRFVHIAALRETALEMTQLIRSLYRRNQDGGCSFLLDFIPCLCDSLVCRLLKKGPNSRAGWLTLKAAAVLLRPDGEELATTLRNAVCNCLSATTDDSMIEALPVDFLLELNLPETAATRSLLLRFFHRRGSQLFVQWLSESNSSTYRPHALAQCEILLDRYFQFQQPTTTTPLSQGSVSIYLAPIHQLLTGVAQRAIVQRQRDDGKRIKTRSMSFMKSIIEVLRLILQSTNYAWAMRSRDSATSVAEGLPSTMAFDGLASAMHEEFWIEAREIFSQMTLEVEYSAFATCLTEAVAVISEPITAGSFSVLERAHPAPPPLYTAVAESLGNALFRAGRRSVALDAQQRLLGIVSDKELAQCLVLLNMRDRSRLHRTSVSYILAACSLSLHSLRNRSSRFFPPPSLPLIEKALVHAAEDGDLAEIYRAQFVEMLADFRSAKQRARDDFEADDITRPDVTTLMSSSSLAETFVRVILEGRGNPQNLFDVLIRRFDVAEREAADLRNVAAFLAQRNLLVHNDERIVLPLAKDISLAELRARNRDLVVSLSLQSDEDEDVLRALITFTRGSDMFSSRFDEFEDRYAAARASIKDQIVSKTRFALQRLRVLVSDTDVCVDDFSRSVTGDVLAELTGQGRRQKKIERDLELIANFFSGMYVAVCLYVCMCV